MSRSEVMIDGMKVKFDKVATLLPTELTTKDGQMVAQSMSLQVSQALGDTLFSPEHLRKVTLDKAGVGSAIGYLFSKFNYLPVDQINKAVEFHIAKLGSPDQLNGTGANLTLFIPDEPFDKLDISPGAILTKEQIQERVETTYRVLYEAQTAALRRLTNIVYWKGEYAEKEKNYFLETLNFVFTTLLGEVKSLLPKLVQTAVDLGMALFKEDIDSLFYAKKAKTGKEAYDFIQEWEFSLARLLEKAIPYAEKYAKEYENGLQAIPSQQDRIAYSESHVRVIHEVRKRYSQSFKFEVDLLARYFAEVHKGAHISIVLKGNPGKGDLQYAGIQGVDEEKRVQFNKEYNMLANELKWPYMRFWEMGLPVKIMMDNYDYRFRGLLSFDPKFNLLNDEYPVTDYLHNRVEANPPQWYLFDIPLNTKNEDMHPVQYTYRRVIFPARFIEK